MPNVNVQSLKVEKTKEQITLKVELELRTGKVPRYEFDVDDAKAVLEFKGHKPGSVIAFRCASNVSERRRTGEYVFELTSKSKTGKEIIDGLQEAIKFAKGDDTGAIVHRVPPVQDTSKLDELERFVADAEFKVNSEKPLVTDTVVVTTNPPKIVRKKSTRKKRAPKKTTETKE
jgi:hypothetical protein